MGGSVRAARWGGSAAGNALVAAGGGAVARRGAGAAALGADGRQLAAAQQTQGLTEAERQAVPLAAWGLAEVTVLGAAWPGALGPGLVATLLTVLLGQSSLGVDTPDQAPLHTTTTGGRALAPGPHDPLRAGVRVAGPRAVGSQRLFAEAWLWAGHQTFLLATTTSLGALPPGRDVPAEAGLHPTGTAGGRHGGPWLAVEGPQWPEVLCVHTLHVTH